MFTAKLYPHALLTAGTTSVDAVITIRSGGVVEVKKSNVVFGGILDCSGSMRGEKIVQARNAMRKVIANLPEDAMFFIVAGTDSAQTVVTLRQATAANKAYADKIVSDLKADGGTGISHWLQKARAEFDAQPTAIHQGLLLTDGQNEEGGNDKVYRQLELSRGKFQLDCRGVGADWDLKLLTRIAHDLLSSVDIIKQPHEMEAEFKAIMEKALSKAINDVNVRLTCPPGTRVEFFKQVSPSMADLTSQGKVNGNVFDFPTGAWGKEESRDYQVRFRLPRAGEVGGARMLAGRVNVVARTNGVEEVLKLDNSAIAVSWTSDEGKSVLAIPAEVSRYTEAGEMVQKVQEALAAREKGDLATATKKLTEANALAEKTGNEGTKKLIRSVADVDQATGTVRIKRDASAEDFIALGTRSVKTKKVTKDE